MNLPQLIIQTAHRRPELRIGTIGHAIALGDALEHASATAARMRADDLDEHDRIAIVANTSNDFIVSWLSCLLAGIPVALVNPSYPPELLERMLDDLGASAVITGGEHPGIEVGRIAYDIAEARSNGIQDPDRAAGLRAGRHSTACLMHTSGTTGRPKFCAQSHEYFLRLGRVMAAALELSESDRVLAPLPLYHINPLGYGIIGALTAGSDAFAMPRFSASAFWPAVVDEQVTVLVMHAPPVEILKRRTQPSAARGHHVRTMFYADSEFMHTFGIDSAHSAYGSTEAGGVTHLRRWSVDEPMPPDASRYGGVCRDDLAWRLSADGEIQISELAPGALFDGYYSLRGLDPVRDEAGWFHTGDLGRLDDRQELVFIERQAESIRVKGEYVPIPYVEQQFAHIADIDDVAIWKSRSELVDDEVVLFVSCSGAIPLESIVSTIARLPGFMRPVKVVQVASIPRDDAAGKVQRRRLGDAAVHRTVQLA